MQKLYILKKFTIGGVENCDFARFTDSKVYKILHIFSTNRDEQKIQKIWKLHCFLLDHVIVVDLSVFKENNTLKYTEILIKMKVFEKLYLMEGKRY